MTCCGLYRNPKIDKNNFTGIKLYSVDDVQTDTDIITVTGVKYTSEEQDYIYGSNDYMITLRGNQLLSGNEKDGVKRIGKLLVGFQLLPFSLSSIPVGYVTFGDAIQFEDYRGNVYWSYATDVEFLFADSTNFSCKAKSVEEQETEYPNENRVLVEQAKEEVHQRMSGYDVKLKQMNNLAANTLGFYYTEEIQNDGSIISYRHNNQHWKNPKSFIRQRQTDFFFQLMAEIPGKQALTQMEMQSLISCMQSALGLNGSIQEDLKRKTMLEILLLKSMQIQENLMRISRIF